MQAFKKRSYGGSKKLKVFHTDPYDYQSIVDAIHGCSGLFYAFEPPHEQLPYDVSSHEDSK